MPLATRHEFMPPIGKMQANRLIIQQSGQASKFILGFIFFMRFTAARAAHLLATRRPLGLIDSLDQRTIYNFEDAVFQGGLIIRETGCTSQIPGR
jgi:hypothetical protein